MWKPWALAVVFWMFTEGGTINHQNLNHILLECSKPEEGKIIWKKKIPVLPGLRNSDSIIACTMAKFRNTDSKPNVGANRLYRIITSQSGHLIWKLRNRRILEPKLNRVLVKPVNTEIHNKWLSTINSRLALDIAITNTKYETKVSPRWKVQLLCRSLLQ